MRLAILCALVVALGHAAPAQPVPLRVDGLVDPAAFLALLPTGGAPGLAGPFDAPTYTATVHATTVYQSASVRTPFGAHALYVTMAVSTPVDASTPPLPPWEVPDGVRVPIGGFAAVYRAAPIPEGSDVLHVALSPTRRFHIQGPRDSRRAFLALARRVDLAAFAALPATYTGWLDPVEREIVDPAAPDLPVIVRAPTPRALIAVFGNGLDGWRVASGSLDVVPVDHQTRGVASDTAFLKVQRCFERLTPEEQAAIRTPTPGETVYRQFHGRYGHGSGDAPPSRPRVCVSLTAGQALSASTPPDRYGPGEDQWMPDTLGGQPVRVAVWRGGTYVLIDRPGGRWQVVSGEPRDVVAAVVRALRLDDIPASTDLVAFDRTPRYSDYVLWDGVYSTPLAPGRLFAQSRHYYPAARIETEWPDGWTWTDPADPDQRLWLAEAGPVDPLSRDALHRAATRGLVLVFAEGIRPDHLLAASGLTDAQAGWLPSGLAPFTGWAVVGTPEPVEVAGSPAAVRLTLRGTVDGVALVAQVVDFVWQGVEAEVVAVVSREDDVPRAAAALAEALRQTTVRPF